MPDAPRRAGFYVRVSDVAGREPERFHSPDLQLAAMREFAARQGLVETAVWQDIDVSGRTFERRGLNEALIAARAGSIDAFVVLDLSRLGRNTGESLRVIAELRELGVTVVSTVEQIDDSPEGQFMLGQFLGMAQLYSDQMGRRWRQVHEHMARDGRQVGQPPLGYRQEDAGRFTPRGRPARSGAFLVDPVLGPAVARAFTDYAAGVRVRDVAERLGALRGRPVWPAQVRKMLRNRFYLGYVTYQGGEHRGRHEPLVDEATWQAVQRRVVRDAKEPTRRLQAASSLSGLAVCDACDAKAVLRSTVERGAGRVVRLGCPRQSDLRACSGCGAMRLEEVEAAVVDQLTVYLAKLKVDDAEQVGRRARRAQAKADAARLRGELQRTRAARSRLLVDRATRDIPAHIFDAADRELAGAEERLVAALGEAEASEGLAPRRAASAVAELLELWGPALPHERNRMLRQVVAQVRLRAGVGWREPVAERVEVVPL